MTLKEQLLALNVFEDNEYLDKYVELIESNRETKREKFKTQKHHIIPRAYFKLNDLDVDDSRENLIHLLYKDHILGHYYLSMCSKDKFKYMMICSINHILGSAKKFCSDYRSICESTQELIKFQDLYEYRREYCSIILKGRKLSKETIDKIQKSRKGYRHSQETKDKIGKANKGENNGMFNKHVSIETRLKLSLQNKGHKRGNGHTGKLYINNGIDCLCVYSQDIEKWLSKGYVRGRITSKKARNNMSKKVLCVELNVVYDSLIEASRATKTQISKISSCCHGNRLTTRGYHWRFYEA